MTADRQSMTPMAEAMATLAGVLGVEIIWPDDRTPTAAELRALPSTERLERELTECQHDFERWGSGRTSGLGYEHRKLRLKVAERHARWGWIRDKVEAGWSVECQCYGDGKVYVPAIKNDRGEEVEPCFWLYCPCQAGDALRAAHGAAQRTAHERRTRELASAIFDYGGDDFAEYANVSLDSYRDRLGGYLLPARQAGRVLASHLLDWTKSDEPWWLVLVGPTGTGKTGLAVSLLKLLAEHGKRGLIVREKAMLDRIRATYSRNRGSDEPTETDVLGELRRVPVLVLDDVAAPGSTTTDWAQGQLFDVLNARYSARRRTIFTSNLEAVEGDELSAYLGPRIWSRVLERTNHGQWIRRVSEPDLRQPPGMAS